MINKKNLWFLTLFSLILVLSVYYITMPNELLLTNSSNYLKDDKNLKKTSVEIEESEILTALRVTSDEKLEKQIDELKAILNDAKTTVDEKNKAFEKMKNLNQNKVKEEELEKKVLDKHKLKLLMEAEERAKENMSVPTKKKKNRFGCLTIILIVSVLIIILYTFAIYYRHKLFLDLGL